MTPLLMSSFAVRRAAFTPAGKTRSSASATVARGAMPPDQLAPLLQLEVPPPPVQVKVLVGVMRDSSSSTRRDGNGRSRDGWCFDQPVHRRPRGDLNMGA